MSRIINGEELPAAWRVVTLGCDLSDPGPPASGVERWHDVPSANADFDAARDTIAVRVLRLLDQCARAGHARSPSSERSTSP